MVDTKGTTTKDPHDFEHSELTTTEKQEAADKRKVRAKLCLTKAEEISNRMEAILDFFNLHQT